MITLYNPKTAAFQAYAGTSDIQDPLLLQVNILIELRAANLIALDAQGGLVTQSVEQYRSDVVNDAKNPSI